MDSLKLKTVNQWGKSVQAHVDIRLYENVKQLINLMLQVLVQEIALSALFSNFPVLHVYTVYL